MADCCNHRIWKSKNSNEFRIFLSFPGSWGMDFIIVVRIFNMKFARIDAHNCTYEYLSTI